ncbi:hypothetical protein BpHYR1_018357 [Brachionus plicatilis]|uniref:Uncharacterized protein n=1 Tax=Brachionus plicatilis TaxID=10195 RepID=A0A3M7PB38_BRAPC|nr:hypothetical protein BpHYR1_018357 [Brachionus plicatilis]
MLDHISQLDHIDANHSVLSGKAVIFDTNVQLVHVGSLLIANGKVKRLIMRPANGALDKRLKHALGAPLERIGSHHFDSDLVLASHRMREHIYLNGALAKLFLHCRIVLTVLGANKSFDQRISGLGVERQGVLETGQLGAFLDERFFETIAIRVKKALYLVQTAFHDQTLSGRQVSLGRASRVAAEQKFVRVLYFGVCRQ